MEIKKKRNRVLENKQVRKELEEQLKYKKKIFKREGK